MAEELAGKAKLVKKRIDSWQGSLIERRASGNSGSSSKEVVGKILVEKKKIDRQQRFW